VTRFAAARALALALPAALLGGALAFQYLGGLVPCEMCYWQRWPHGAAIVVALAAFVLPSREARAAVVVAALLAMVSGGIGVYHWGVEQHIFEGLTQCSSAASGGDAADVLKDIFATTRIIRCDQPQWSLFGISMAGWNAILSLGLGLVILWLTLKPSRR
jgi:disulfide bond formation protein DsbB